MTQISFVSSKPAADANYDVAVELANVTNQRDSRRRRLRCIGALVASLVLGILLAVAIVLLSRLIVGYCLEDDHNNSGEYTPNCPNLADDSACRDIA
jgi:hypothetical protein